MIFSKNDPSESMNIPGIETLIPQRQPIVLIDELKYSGEDKTITLFRVPEVHLFVKNGVLREPGIVENIAQTAAARAGYDSKNKGEKPPIGFIGDISKLEIIRLPETGSVLTTAVTPVQQVFDITLVKGIVEDERGLIARCEMKIVIKNNQAN